MEDFGKRRAEALKFIRQPDPNYFSFQSFMKAAMEEIFVFDALSLLLKPKRGRGLGKGILGSDLDCINLVDGPTIRAPARTPRRDAPPARARVQPISLRRSPLRFHDDGR